MRGRNTWMALVGLSMAALARAQVLVGQTASFNGPDSAYVREARTGATLYFDAVNEQGGVHGQKVELVSIDDAGDAQRAARNVRALMGGWNAIALFLSRGTSTSQAAAAALPAYGAALVGPSSGSQSLRQPVHPLVFNVRASYRREAQQAVQSMARLGLTRLAVVQANNAFGDDAAVGVVDADPPVRPVLVEKLEPERADFAAMAARVAKADAQVVLFLADGAEVAAGVRALREAGSRAQVMTLSNNASPGFIQRLGTQARGVIVTQVFPYERSMVSPLVKRAMDVGRTRGIHELTQPLMEGFAAAQVLVEGLRRAGPKPTREKLVEALNGIARFNIGGVMIDYSSTDHVGTTYSDMSVISEMGRFQR
ncbi:MAG TPA: ABC transporter substrate-binding protein [Albitalea sp.]|uniref:ABC transporter substrate-binding protein n=1 Tax=Piscinibacter sp. TaxID=1903157 RepID=UPI002ED33FBA